MCQPGHCHERPGCGQCGGRGFHHGSEAIAIKRGVLNVTGGTFTATGDAVKDPVTANNNGTEDTGAAISVTSTYNKYAH